MASVTTDRKTIRREVGRDYGDILILTATATGSTLSFVDTARLVLPDNAYKSREIRFTSGTNAGLSRKVTASAQSSKTLSWQVETTIATATSDEAELWNTHGIGITSTEVDDAINTAIRFASARFWIPTYAAVSAAYDADATVFTVPAALTRGVFAVHYDNAANSSLWTRIPKAMSYGDPGWYLDRALGVIRLSGDWMWMADDRTLRVYGYGEATVPSTDASTTPVNFNWVVAKAKEIVLEHHLSEHRDDPTYRLRWEKAAAEAAKWEPAAFGRRDPDVELL